VAQALQGSVAPLRHIKNTKFGSFCFDPALGRVRGDLVVVSPFVWTTTKYGHEHVAAR
jgi:hypothetical protein